MEYNGVDTEHPSVRDGIRVLQSQGKRKEEIMRIIGVPKEVVDKHKDPKGPPVE